MTTRPDLRYIYSDLIRQLDPASVSIFFEKSLVTKSEKEQVELSASTRTEKNTKLVSALMRRPDTSRALKAIIEVLKEDKDVHSELLQKIYEKYPSYAPSYSTDDTKQDEQTDDKKQPLQSNETVRVEVPSLRRFDQEELIPVARGSDATPSSPTNLQVKKVSDVFNESTDGPKSDRYSIFSVPRGYCVIINNIKFKTMKDRSGSEWDADNLKRLFGRHLGFFIQRYDNLTTLQMQLLMRDVRDQDHSKLSCLVIAILTHGIEGQVYGTDGSLVKVDDLTAYFDGTQCPSLVGKPKIFILQACRGGIFDEGVEATDDGSTAELDYEEVDGRYSLLPDKADFVLAYATTPRYVSWRNSAFGTWFVKAFVDTMYERAETDHLIDILTEVNRKVAEEYESRGKQKQMPAPVTMLRYKLYLPPPVNKQ